MAVNIPTLRLEFFDSPSDEEREARDKVIAKHLDKVTLKDESGQTNDILKLSFLDDGTIKAPPLKSQIGLLIGYITPAETKKPKDIINVTKTIDTAKKIQEFIANQARGIAYNIYGKYLPNFVVSSQSGTFTGQKPSNDPTDDLKDREAIFYNIGTYTVNRIFKRKTPNEKYLEIECITISAIDNMKKCFTRNFNGKTLEEVASIIAIESGLNLVVHSDVATKTIEDAQTDTSNQLFLKNICEKYNAAFKIINNTIFINHRDAETTVTNVPLPEIEIVDREDIIDYDLTLDTGSTLTGVFARYRTNNNDELVTILEGDTTGSTRTLATPFINEEVARSEARVRLNREVKNEEVLTFTTDGSKLLVPDSKFKIISDDQDINNKRFKVTSANYTLTSGNFRVSYNCERA